MTTNYKVTNADFNFSDLADIYVRRELISQSSEYSWGENNFGQLGTNNATDRSSPGTVFGSPFNNWRVVANGADHSVGIKTDGTIWLWGRNDFGQLGDGTTTSRSSPVTASGGGSNWKSVACGEFHTVALKSDGTLWTWGRNDQGQLGDNSATNRSSPVTTSGGGSDWEVVGAGLTHSLGIKTAGTLWTWGLNSTGQLGDNSTTNRSSPVTTSGGGTTWFFAAGGANHSLATRTDGTLWTWGGNISGQLGESSTTSRSSPGTTAGGTLNWRFVAAGLNFSVATKYDGTLWTWGANGTGQLGDGSTTSRSSPGTTAGGGTTWKNISSFASTTTTASVKGDGTLWMWGLNSIGQLGDNSITNKSSPVTVVGGIANWKRVAVGGLHTTALVDLSF